MDQFWDSRKNNPITTRFKKISEKEPKPVNSWPIKDRVRPRKNPVTNRNEICMKDCADVLALDCAP